MRVNSGAGTDLTRCSMIDSFNLHIPICVRHFNQDVSRIKNHITRSNPYSQY